MEQKTFLVLHNYTYPETQFEDHLLPIFSTFHHVPVVIFTYLLWATIFGPRMMRFRKPFKLRGFLMVYNMLQVLLNLYLVCLACQKWGFGILRIWSNICNPIEATIGYDKSVQLAHLEFTYSYYLTKILDLLDTVFFILRKKQSQVTFLHLFHHSTMIFNSWMTLVIREQISALFGVLNMAIHVFMYSYYFLSAFGPHMQKYLWWKKHLTKMQMGQLAIMLAALVKMKIINCKCNPMFWGMWTVNIFIYLVLFLHYYWTSYKKKKVV